MQICISKGCNCELRDVGSVILGVKTFRGRQKRNYIGLIIKAVFRDDLLGAMWTMLSGEKIKKN